MLDGEDITYQKEHVRSKVIGHLFQDPLKGTAPHMTIEENMALAYLRTTTSKNAYFSRIKAADKKKFREQLALLDMGLEDRMKQPVGLLSGGQRQALTLLMATMVTPKILLLDEHTAALDPKTAEIIMELTDQVVKAESIVIKAHSRFGIFRKSGTVNGIEQAYGFVDLTSHHICVAEQQGKLGFIGIIACFAYLPIKQIYSAVRDEIVLHGFICVHNAGAVACGNDFLSYDEISDNVCRKDNHENSTECGMVAR